MLTVIIATHESERPLLATLAALVPGAGAGLVREVIVADAGSKDATAAVADIAGCRIMVSAQPLGARLAQAVREARAGWLMFLRPGSVPEGDWIADVGRFLELADLSERGSLQAAVFRRALPTMQARPQLVEALGLIFAALRAPQAQQGLLIGKRLYQEIGGHRAETADPETDLLRRLGRGRIAILKTGIAGV